MFSPIRQDFLVFGKPRIEQDEIDEIVDSLRSGWLSTGPKVKKFEELFREYIGSKFAVALNSCTAGLHLALLVVGVGRGDEVITTPMTFAATANVIIHAGAKPIFVDVDKKTMNIDPELIEAKITPRTKAIIAVHFAGRPCKMDAIIDIAKKHDLIVIEDAAHAIEAIYQNRKIGTIGHITVFSFYATKNLVTGEGGMVTTNNEEWARQIQIMGLHGLSHDAWQRYSSKGFKHYEVVCPGFKYNMMDLQAALGIHQIKRVEHYLKRREEIWKLYDENFVDLPVIIPAPVDTGDRHARHLYTLLIDIDALGVTRDEVRQRLYQENIGTGIHFTALHLHKYYRDTFGFRRGIFPNSEYISDRTISLPLSAGLSDSDVEDVVSAVKKVLKDVQR